MPTPLYHHGWSAARPTHVLQNCGDCSILKILQAPNDDLAHPPSFFSKVQAARHCSNVPQSDFASRTLCFSNI